MQIRGLHRDIYRGARLSSRIEAKERSDAAKRSEERRVLVDRWLQARRDGLTAEAAAKAVGKPRSTLSRWRKQLVPRSTRPHKLRVPSHDPKLVAAVERLRKKHPMWGKDKLAPLLWREGFGVSVSKVGRILEKLVERGVIVPVPKLRKGSKHAKKQKKRIHAQRLPKGTRPTRPGQIVQLDTLHIGLAPGKSIRQFTAYCPVAKWTIAKAFNRGTAAAAKLFLDKLVDDMPFKVEAIQVDGGSEFMAEFEAECARRDLKLFVLPPRMPELNGGVERCNGAWRYEFYACTELPGGVEELNPLIDDWADTYNFVRPHGALSGLTPSEYLLARQAKEAPRPSHMS